MNIMDKVKFKGLKALKAFLPVIESGIKGFMPDLIEDKSKFPLLENEADLVALLYLSNGDIMVMLATITTDNKINRVIWKKTIAESLELIANKI